MDDELRQLHDSLLRGLDFVVGPDEGEEAFERHQLLAIRFHRASRLNIPTNMSETKVWIHYFGDYLPEMRGEAQLLFKEWRCALLKDEYPGNGIVLSHGTHQQHQGDTDRGYCVNLETMRDHFVASVDRFVARLRSEAGMRQRTLDAFRARQWIVVNVTPLGRQVGVWPRLSTFQASATSGPGTINPDVHGSPPHHDSAP